MTALANGLLLAVAALLQSLFARAGHDLRPIRGVGRQHPVVPHQVETRRRHQGGQLFEQLFSLSFFGSSGNGVAPIYGGSQTVRTRSSTDKLLYL